MSGSSAITSSSTWNANRSSQRSSAVGVRRLTTKTETDRAPGGASSGASTGRIERATFSPSSPGRSRSTGFFVLAVSFSESGASLGVLRQRNERTLDASSGTEIGSSTGISWATSMGWSFA
jgi:hypothetical protein